MIRNVVSSTPFRGSVSSYAYMVQLVPTNVVSDWFTDLANSLAESLNNQRVEIVKSLVKTALPSLEQLQNGWFMTAFGGTMGLANLLVTAIAVLTTLFMILSPNRNHAIRINRTVTSLLYTSVFGFLFFKLYSLAYGLTQAFTQGMINIAVGKSSSSLTEAANLLVQGAFPPDVWVKVIVAGLGFLLTYLAFVVAYANVIAIFFIGIFYVLALVMRPLGETFNDLFHVFNSGLATTLVTPIIIVFGLILPFAVNRYIPFGSSSVGLGLSTVLGSAIAMAGPPLFAAWAYRKSSRIFGHVDAQISGRVDVDSMPTPSSEMMGESFKESAVKSFVSTFGAGAATAGLSQSDDMKGDLRKLATEAAGTAAAAAGHPWVAAALSTVDTTLAKEKRQHVAAEGPQGETPPPPPQHMPPPPPSATPRPPAPEAPSTPSPIVEYPGRKS